MLPGDAGFEPSRQFDGSFVPRSSNGRISGSEPEGARFESRSRSFTASCGRDVASTRAPTPPMRVRFLPSVPSERPARGRFAAERDQWSYFMKLCTCQTCGGDWGARDSRSVERGQEALFAEPHRVLFRIPDFENAPAAVRSWSRHVEDATGRPVQAELCPDLLVDLLRAFRVVHQDCDRHVGLLLGVANCRSDPTPIGSRDSTPTIARFSSCDRGVSGSTRRCQRCGPGSNPGGRSLGASGVNGQHTWLAPTGSRFDSSRLHYFVVVIAQRPSRLCGWEVRLGSDCRPRGGPWGPGSPIPLVVARRMSATCEA